MNYKDKEFKSVSADDLGLESNEKKEEIKECDGGDVAGATSADVCNMSAPILPLRQPQHRTINGVSKKKKNEPSDILGKTITAESTNKKHKICYITEEQLDFLIGTKK